MAWKLRHIKNPYLRNLFFAYEDIPTNPLVHIFLYVTLVVGLSFVFFADPTGASQLTLYKVTLAKLGPIAINIWGLAGILAVLGSIASHIYRRKWLGHTGTFLGWAVWLFACIMYFLGGLSIGIFAFALPNLAFWTWQYFSVSKYHLYFKAGLYPRRKRGRILPRLLP